RVEELIHKDSSLINSFSVDGFYPLGLATFFKHPETAKLLIELGADVNTTARNAIKVSPLHAAAPSREVELARLLLERGADVNGPDVNARERGGCAGVDGGALNGDGEFVRLLLDCGADVNAKPAAGKTALRYALDAGQQEAARLLRERGGVE